MYVNEPSMIASEHLGSLPDGRAVPVFTLIGTGGAEVRVMAYGAVVLSLRAADREGRLEDVVLGYDSLDGYLADRCFMGSVVGRYANRIRGGRFELDGREYTLETNDGPNHLHGGHDGFHRRLWTGGEVPAELGVALRLQLSSGDGDQGYPGTLEVAVTYTLTPMNALIVAYEATADRATVVNLTQHSYFNLAGAGSVLDHLLTLDADRYAPVDETLIPTGELAPVEATPFDFTRPRTIGERIDSAHPQMRVGHGYDHNFVRNGHGLWRVARLFEPRSGRVMDVVTTEPGVQLYSGNRLPSPRTGLCLETQHFPDSPHHAAFPSTELAAGQRRRSTTVWHFGVH